MSDASPQTTDHRPAAPVRWVEDPVTGTALTAEAEHPGEQEEPESATSSDGAVALDGADEIDVEVGPGEVRCEQCQSVMGRDDIFCGECGFVSRSVTRAFSSDFTGETRQLDFSPEALRDDLPLAKPEPEPQPEPEPDPEPAPDPAPAPEPAVLPAPPAAQPPTTPERRSFVYDEDDDAEDLEATRIVSRVSGNRFVLQFSTGESFTVHGTGLIGRNPQPEPGEFFDHLVRILDSGKSVSKTHLEFGQEGGAFWLKDRFSGNGTIIREPDISARRAEPDRRYRVVRGTRIDVGEQFFVIS